MNTILLIEDNEQNRYLATFLLERQGFTVIPASDGPRGIEMARTLAPDLVLLDIQLPTMHGYAVAEALRENPALDAVPIVAVTSYAMVGDRERALAAGCTGYIEKPINPETFVEAVRAYCAGEVRPEAGNVLIAPASQPPPDPPEHHAASESRDATDAPTGGTP